ncbi:MAG: hypothetical protein K2J96_06705 [Bacteroidaceae bacterium]|nr:hypothetical protein [Bacteroidaceae bacterium]
MAIQFTIAERGQLPGEENERRNLYPRLKSHRTVDVVDFQKRAPWPSAMSAANLQFALGELQRIMLHELKEGNAVTLPGIGTFRLNLKGSVAVRDGQYHGEDVHVDSLQFQPDRELAEQMQKLPVEQQPYGLLLRADEADVEERLTELFRQHDSITHKNVFQAFGAALSPHRVTSLLQRLTAEGRLLREGERAQTVYRPAPGHFGRED